MTIWGDLPRGACLEGHRGVVIQSCCGDVRLALIMGITEVIDKKNRGKRLRFIYDGKEKKGILRSIRVYLSEIASAIDYVKLESERGYSFTLHQRTYTQRHLAAAHSYVACSLFLQTEYYNGPLQQYMTCDIVAPDGRRSDDIFVFLTEIFPIILQDQR